MEELEFEDLFNEDSNQNKSQRKSASGLSPPCSPYLIPDTYGDPDVPVDAVLSPRASKRSLSNYDILKVVGRGAYGKVYQVRDKETREIYAMKSLRKHMLVKTNNVEYTKLERDILRKIRHPFIVSLYHAFQSEDRVFLVMDFLNGGQLLYHLREEAMFSEDVARFYCAEVLLALEHLHSRHIVHRDIKPENLLLDAEGHVNLTDFGLAKMLLHSGDRTGTWCGTLDYMAPEMLLGKKYDASVDFWSLGVLCFDMLTGRPPFSHSEDAELERLITTARVRIPPYVSGVAAKFIRQLLHKDPAMRLGYAEESELQVNPAAGFEAIKAHRFFKGVEWRKMAAREVPPPFRPVIEKGALDVGNFDEEYITEAAVNSPVLEADRISASQDKMFHGFTWTRSFSPQQANSLTDASEKTNE